MADPQTLPMTRSLSTDVAGAAMAMHEAAGVRCLMGVGVTGITGRKGQLTVTLDDGTELRAATVVVGIGAVPNDGWLAGSGLTVENGVVCDEYCRAVGTTHVYAVGDVARWFDRARGAHVRAEHWTNAVDQAACVAHNILHPTNLRAYEPVEFVWSDQHGWKIQVVGDTTGSAATTLLGDPTADRRFAALYADGQGLLRGTVVVNWPRVMVQCRKALREGTAWSDLEPGLRAVVNAASRPETKA
ncbi:FAD-dependent oxidoreductase [Streptomyces albipurpureus]